MKYQRRADLRNYLLPIYLVILRNYLNALG
jgi:hypothetical protein